MSKKFMSRFRFQSPDGRDIKPREWLHMWAVRYPSKVYKGYGELIARHDSLSAADFVQIGQWKDRAKTPGKWKPNVASVAYLIWMQAASELPKCPAEIGVAGFLDDWSCRKYTDKFPDKSQEKRFGLPRATTLLHFLSGGRFPIVDSRTRRAMTRLLNVSTSTSVHWYLNSYCPFFSEVAVLCGTEDLRMVDKALFSYGGRVPLLSK